MQAAARAEARAAKFVSCTAISDESNKAEMLSSSSSVDRDLQFIASTESMDSSLDFIDAQTNNKVHDTEKVDHIRQEGLTTKLNAMQNDSADQLIEQEAENLAEEHLTLMPAQSQSPISLSRNQPNCPLSDSPQSPSLSRSQSTLISSPSLLSPSLTRAESTPSPSEISSPPTQQTMCKSLISPKQISAQINQALSTALRVTLKKGYASADISYISTGDSWDGQDLSPDHLDTVIQIRCTDKAFGSEHPFVYLMHAHE